MLLAELRNLLLYKGLEYFNRYYSFYRGKVLDNKDPDFRGRLKIDVPSVYNGTKADYWALPKGMFAGKQIGLYAIPNIGDVVWVSFEQGDVSYPVWEYGWFINNAVPEKAKVDGKNPKNIILQSTSKHSIELDDHNKLIRITDSNGNVVELNEKGVSIVSDKISLGTLNKSKEKAVLGDTLVSLLTDLIDDIGNVGLITTNTGVTNTINTSPNWSVLKKKWQEKFKNFLSNKLTLD
jgi:hypothetical protein